MANTPYQTTDPLYKSGATPNEKLGFFGATGSVGPIQLTGATAGNQLVSLQDLQAALVALGLIKTV